MNNASKREWRRVLALVLAVLFAVACVGPGGVALLVLLVLVTDYVRLAATSRGPQMRSSERGRETTKRCFYLRRHRCAVRCTAVPPYYARDQDAAARNRFKTAKMPSPSKKSKAGWPNALLCSSPYRARDQDTMLICVSARPVKKLWLGSPLRRVSEYVTMDPSPYRARDQDMAAVA